MELWYVIGSIFLLVVMVVVFTKGQPTRHFRLECLE